MPDSWTLDTPDGPYVLNPSFAAPQYEPGGVGGPGALRRDERATYQRSGDGLRTPGPLTLVGRVWRDDHNQALMVAELNAIRAAVSACTQVVRTNNAGSYTYDFLAGGATPEITPDGLGGWIVKLDLWPGRAAPSFVPVGPGGIMYLASTYDANPGSQRDTVAIAKPTGVTEGDVMLASIGYRGRNFTITPPSGWALVLETTADSISDPTVATFVRTAEAEEPDLYTWGLSGGRYVAGGIAAFRGVDTSTPIRDAQGVFDTTDNDPFPSALCADGDAALFVAARDGNMPDPAAVVADGATLAYAPGGIGSLYFDMGASYELGQAAPATGERSPEQAQSADFVLHTITLRPAP